MRGKALMEPLARPTIFGRNLGEATAVLLATIRDLPNLKELVIDDVLHGGKLEKECEARGIRLRSSVGAGDGGAE